MSLKLTLSDHDEVTTRIQRIRQLCTDLEKALGTAEKQRALIAQMKDDADALYKALSAKQT